MQSLFVSWLKNIWTIFKLKILKTFSKQYKHFNIFAGQTIVQAQPMQYVVSSAQGGVPFAGQRPPFMTQMAPAGGMLPGPLPTQQIVLGQQIMPQQQVDCTFRVLFYLNLYPSIYLS